MREQIMVIAVGALIGGTLFLVARRFIRLACAMKRLRDAANRPNEADGTACPVCSGAGATTGPVFPMWTAGLAPQAMPEKIWVTLPMCPDCHIRLIRFDFWCTLASLGWCVGLLAALVLLKTMSRGIGMLMDLAPSLFVYFVFPLAIYLFLVMPHYYRRVIRHPLVAQMVRMGHWLGNRNRYGLEIESCDWVEIIGDVPSATTKPV